MNHFSFWRRDGKKKKMRFSLPRCVAGYTKIRVKSSDKYIQIKELNKWKGFEIISFLCNDYRPIKRVNSSFVLFSSKCFWPIKEFFEQENLNN